MAGPHLTIESRLDDPLDDLFADRRVGRPVDDAIDIAQRLLGLCGGGERIVGAEEELVGDAVFDGCLQREVQLYRPRVKGGDVGVMFGCLRITTINSSHHGWPRCAAHMTRSGQARATASSRSNT